RGEGGKARCQLVVRCGASINHQSMPKNTLLSRSQQPVAERGDVRIDQPLLVGAPTGGMVWIGGMIQDGDAEGFASERPLDVAPGGALLLACPIVLSV